MFRNTEVPQGIKADRLGFPKKTVGSHRMQRLERNALLGEYNNTQLTTLHAKLQKSENIWKTAKIGGFALAATAFIAKSFALGLGSFEVQHGLSLDPVTSTILQGYRGEMELLSHIGVSDRFTQAMTSVYGVSIGIPLVTGITGQYMENHRSKQQSAVESEQKNREIKKMIQAAIEATQAKQTTVTS